MNYQRSRSQVPGEKHREALVSCNEQTLKRLKFLHTETPLTRQHYMASSSPCLTSQICGQFGGS